MAGKINRMGLGLLKQTGVVRRLDYCRLCRSLGKAQIFFPSNAEFCPFANKKKSGMSSKLRHRKTEFYETP